MTARHVHNDKSTLIGSERDPFPPTVPPSGKAGRLQRVGILNFRRLVSIYWREPARSPRFFPTTATPNPTVREEVVGGYVRTDGSCRCRAWLLSRATLHNEWTVRPGRDRCVAVIGDDSPLVGGESDALNSNSEGSKSLRMEFGLRMELREEMESSRPAWSGSSVISASASCVRVRVVAGGECP